MYIPLPFYYLKNGHWNKPEKCMSSSKSISNVAELWSSLCSLEHVWMLCSKTSGCFMTLIPIMNPIMPRTIIFLYPENTLNQTK